MNIITRINKRSVRTFAPKLLRVVGLLSITAVPSLFAQETDDEQVIELSPFTVDSTADTGYAATQSLAGTRIKSNLRDVSATVQAVTKEMLDDLGATSLNELLSYTTSTEAGGDLGNFTGVGVVAQTSVLMRVPGPNLKTIYGCGV